MTTWLRERGTHGSALTLVSPPPLANSRIHSPVVGPNVDVSNVAPDIARGLNMEASRVPAVVQVPLDVAAKVCAVDVDMLAQKEATGNAKCS